jgi:hypothetical protein
VKGIRGRCQAFPCASVNGYVPGMLFAPHLNLP